MTETTGEPTNGSSWSSARAGMPVKTRTTQPAERLFQGCGPVRAVGCQGVSDRQTPQDPSFKDKAHFQSGCAGRDDNAVAVWTPVPGGSCMDCTQASMVFTFLTKDRLANHQLPPQPESTLHIEYYVAWSAAPLRLRPWDPAG